MKNVLPVVVVVGAGLLLWKHLGDETAMVHDPGRADRMRAKAQERIEAGVPPGIDLGKYPAARIEVPRVEVPQHDAMPDIIMNLVQPREPTIVARPTGIRLAPGEEIPPEYHHARDVAGKYAYLRVKHPDMPRAKVRKRVRDYFEGGA